MAQAVAQSLSPTVEGARFEFGGASVRVTVLVDAVLRRHSRDYLSDWQHRDPIWPQDGLEQDADRWLDEARVLLRAPTMFGRIAIVAWCLLDDAIATEAVASGLLGGLAAETAPALADYLSDTGVALLRQRAPLVALQEGLLEPAVDLRLEPGLQVRDLALSRQARTGRRVGRWAVAFHDRVSTGEGATWDYAYPVTDGETPGFSSTVDVRAIGFSGNGRLHVLLGSGASGLVRLDAGSGAEVPLQEPWPPAATGVIGESSLAVVPLQEGRDEVLFGVTDGGGPVATEPQDLPIAHLAVAGDRVVALSPDGVVQFSPQANSWTVAGTVSGPASLAMTEHEALVGDLSGTVHRIGWDGRTSAVVVLPGEEVRMLRASGPFQVAASDRSIGVLAGEALVARWRHDEGADKRSDPGAAVGAVAVSADGRALGFAGAGRVRFWRVDAAPELQLTAYLADTPDGDDLLGVQPSVDALAAIISARVVQPPLSIGLFGSWGSGKSFFMRRLERRVEEVTGQARDSGRPQAALWAWRQVRQVRFNAWHYAAADVWAGMLEQLIRGVSVRQAAGELPLDIPDELDALERARIARLAGARATVAATDEALSRARAQLAEARTRSATELEDMVTSDALAVLDASLTRAGLQPVGGDLRTLLAAASNARSKLADLGRQVPTEWRTLAPTLAAGAVVLVLVLVASVLWPERVSALWGILAAALGAAVTVVTWVGTTADSRARRLGEQAKAEQDALRAEEKVQEALAATSRELEAAQRHAQQVTVGDLLNEYLAGRDSSRDYRGSTGLIGTVRRDLEVISDSVAANNRELTQPGAGPVAGADAVNRVVLYIDDLDRCRPEIVVKVLEAVSMLLSFELFVVVVAVDAHWVSRSLAAVYPDLLSGGEVTPDNYLEKIFQLPVWLERPSPAAATAMATALLGGPLDPRATGREEDDGAGEAAGPASVPGRAPDEVGGPAHPDGRHTGSVSLATTPPAAVTLQPTETQAIASLAPMLARSPRALKRYINTYRLVKALVAEEHLERARLLLAVATGRPATGERLLTQLGGWCFTCVGSSDRTGWCDRITSYASVWVVGV
jgi:hypothetical protein